MSATAARVQEAQRVEAVPDYVEEQEEELGPLRVHKLQVSACLPKHDEISRCCF